MVFTTIGDPPPSKVAPIFSTNPVPAVVSRVPAVDGRTMAVAVPAIAGALSTLVPEVAPYITRLPAIGPVAFPIVTDVPNHAALAALIPPEVLMAPVIEEEVSRVLGKRVDALPPVPPRVKRVVAPAKAVNEVEVVVMLVVTSGEVIAWMPVNVWPASLRATVIAASGRVTIRGTEGPAKVTCPAAGPIAIEEAVAFCDTLATFPTQNMLFSFAPGVYVVLLAIVIDREPSAAELAKEVAVTLPVTTWLPVKVWPASIRATVIAASGRVMVLAVVPPVVSNNGAASKPRTMDLRVGPVVWVR
jgi:hypothetical protein